MIEVSNMSDGQFDTYITAVQKECPDVDSETIAAAFLKYQEDFKIPPQDSMRSIIRSLNSSKSVPSTRSSGSSSSKPRATKKVERLSELKADDKEIEIEVEIISHNMREQTIRGEQKQIAFGLLEDNPWAENGDKNRWEYKDWAPSPNLAPGSIVRLEGVSVNEYQGKMSLNINQSSRVVVIREGTRAVVAPGEAQDIATLPNDGYVCVVGRVLSSRKDQIHKKDGSGSIDIVRGRLADESGTIGFLSWESFEHEVGALIKIDGAQVRTFRDTPELNFGRTTKVELFHDKNFADTETLSVQTVLTISDLRDGSRDVDAIVQITEWAKRTFTRDGVEKYLWSGQIADPTGRCRMSAWEDLPIDENNLPITVRLKGVRVRAWQGIPDITVDNADQVEILETSPWDEDIDFSTQTVEVVLNELATGASRVGVSTEAIVVSVREDSGFIQRCTECRRVLRDGHCATHDANAGNTDVRMRLVIDDGLASMSLLINKEGSLGLLAMTEDDLGTEISSNGQSDFVQTLRSKMLGRKIRASGRTIVDEQGGMMLADSAELVEEDAEMKATEIRAQWGVN
jgi:replication factor A1